MKITKNTMPFFQQKSVSRLCCFCVPPKYLLFTLRSDMYYVTCSTFVKLQNLHASSFTKLVDFCSVGLPNVLHCFTIICSFFQNFLNQCFEIKVWNVSFITTFLSWIYTNMFFNFFRNMANIFQFYIIYLFLNQHN